MLLQIMLAISQRHFHYLLFHPKVHEQEQLEAPDSQGSDGDGDVGEFLPYVKRDRCVVIY